MVKIVFLGAGSIGFSESLIADILSFPELSDSEICLMDIDTDRLELMTKLARKYVIQEGFNAVITSTSDRREALKDAGFIITILQAGGLKAYEHDINIPLKYGVKQVVGDTLGPGGVFRFLRTAKVFKDIARDINELCPDAFWLNYVNPMAMNCWYLNKISNIKNVGLCHSVQTTTMRLASMIGVPYNEVSFISAGINHMAWLIDFKWKGMDVYPRIKEKYNDSEKYNRDVTKFEFLKYFGYWVTESSLHMAEYVPYFGKFDEWLKHIYGNRKGEFAGMNLRICQGSADSFINKTRERVEAERIDIETTHEYATYKAFVENMHKVESESLKTVRSYEYASYIIHSIVTGTPRIIYGNVENKGLITNLPAGCCVEVPCLIDKNGIQPTYIGKLPAQLAALNRTNINVQELAVQGAVSGDKEAVYQAVMMDPLTASVLTMPQIHKMVSELFEAEKQWLPEEFK